MKINNKDFFDDVKTYDDFTFNTILSDIPYNLGSSWVIDDDGTYQIKGSKAKDFMNKWEGLDGKALDEMFKEMFRVMKYGGYLLLFGLDRQLGPLHYYATKNGFDINQSLYWYFVCNDKSTELLTKRGWLKWNEINKDDKVLTFNKDNETSEWQDVKDIHIYDVDEQEMVRIKNQNIDQLVTPNHRVLRKHKTNPRYEYGDWEYIESFNLLKTKNPLSIFPLSFENDEGINDKNKLYYELLGWIFTDGYYSKKDNGIRISQCKDKGVENLELLLNEMNIDYSKYERYRDIKIGDYEYENYKENIYYLKTSILTKQIKTLYPDKKPTYDLLDLSLENRTYLFNGMMNGDGSYKNETSGSFKKNQYVNDFIQSLIQSLGYRTKQTNDVVYFSHHNTTEIQKQIKTEKYTGKVWSITTDNSNYCIRRNGCVSFTGNSNFPKATDAGKMIDKRLKKKREVVGKKTGGAYSEGTLNKGFGQLHTELVNDGRKKETSRGEDFGDITTAASDLSKVFDGYKYSKAPLKQMVETICVFSKPTKNKSVLDDLMEWGEGVDLLNYNPKVSKKERNLGLDEYSITTIKLFEGNELHKYKEYKLWENQDLKVVLQVDTELSTRKDIDEFKSLMETNIEQLWNTDISGNLIMDQSQMDTTSTTEIETLSTTELKTWNWLIELITKEYILDANSVKMDGGNLVVNVEDLNTKITTTNQNKDGSLDNVKNVELKSPLKIRVIVNPLKSGHPTLKPIELIYNISKLFKLPDIVEQKIYIPFAGSFSEVIGVAKAGYDIDKIYGCEVNKEYYDIGMKRYDYFKKQNDL